MKIVLLFVLIALFPIMALAGSYPGASVYGEDSLMRPLPEASELQPFHNDRYVGVFYFLWLNLDAVHDISRILSENPAAHDSNKLPEWGPLNTFHFWGEPLYGYYRSDDPWVLRRHAMLLSDAGVDFLIFDATNAIVYEKVFMKLCAVFEEQRLAGAHVPQIAFMVNSAAGKTAQTLYDILYAPKLYPELWFQWQGKPLLLCEPAEATDSVKDFFTLRKAHWPFELVDTHNEWHWEATYPQVYSYDKDPEKAEQVNVSVGQNLHQEDGRVEMMSTGYARGRSFCNGRMDTRPDAWKYGLNFEEQWQRAFELEPEIVFITGWNEWIAMQLNSHPGPVVFCDQYNLEFSRDVEMMKGGYGDSYYMQMASQIRKFKGMNAAPDPHTSTAIDIAGSLDQWNAITAAYSAHPFSTLPRDYPGCGEEHYTVTTGRNDFVLLKAAHDADSIYFYAETRDTITAHTDPNWMCLLVDMKDKSRPEWEGFSYIINRRSPDMDAVMIERSTGDWNWEPAGKGTWKVVDHRMHIAVPRSTLGINEGAFRIEFKWIDNARYPGDIMDTYINGDTAPLGRFRYRYEGR